jgi:hypothetical protein
MAQDFISIVPQERILGKIIFLRGQKVILDEDIAELYNVKTKILNQAVKRNIKRFPKDFMFQLTQQEFTNLKSQFVTSSFKSYGGRRKLPFAFTEQGVAMLSSVLKSERAVQLNIAIIRAFVYLRHLIQSNTELANRIEKLELQSKGNNEQLGEIYALINELVSEKKGKWTEEDEARSKRPLGFDLG